MMAAFIVGAIAIIMSAVTFIVQRYTTIKYKIKEMQALVKQKNEMLKECYANKSSADQKKADELQKEILDISMDMMKTNFKNLLWVMLINILVISYIVTMQNDAYPISGFWGISAVFVWYILMSITANVVLRIVYNVLENYKVLSGSYD